MTELTGDSIPYTHIGIIGAGAWGTALALVAAEAGRKVTLWAREPAVVEAIAVTRENSLFLPGVTLPEAISATGEIAKAAEADAVLMVPPAQHLRTALTAVALHARRDVPLVVCAKGIERGTGKLVNEVLADCAPHVPPAILSGPSFARDVAKNLPTAVTIAAAPDIAARLQAALGHLAFRPYASDDLTGVALGGAAKNVYAIACGIVAGLGLGDSARAALIARSFAELSRLGDVLGAKRETLMGLSGLGDLVLTATSLSSRNYRFGFELGKGEALANLAKPGQPLAEGVETAPALAARARQHGVELPIAETMEAVLGGNLPLGDALMRLMSRPLRPE